ncbi:hypothetical protein DRJ25_04890 [Candidatus Woesearchaeota archaeon]|nr:MAG: hypothetical protein DRJ25_04890 [Candidatus Woesearchaeota archaeon]
MYKFYNSEQIGAPEIHSVQGNLIDFFDCLLVNGFHSLPISTITRSGTIATATFVNAHLYVEDQILLISGANQAEYNGEFEIFNITVKSFDFTVVDTVSTPATGALFVKVAPAGWTITAAVGDKKIYRYPGGHQYYLVLNEETCPELGAIAGGTPYTTATIQIVESVVDIDTYGNTTGTVYVRKGITEDKGPQKWAAVVSERGMHFAIGWTTKDWVDLTTLGEFNSNVIDDQYNIMISGHYSYSGSTYHQTQLYSGTDAYHYAQMTVDVIKLEIGSYLLRDYMGANDTICAFQNVLLNSSGFNDYSANNSFMPFRSLVDGSVYLNQVYINEFAGVRGQVAGLFFPMVTFPECTFFKIERNMIINGQTKNILFLQMHMGIVGIDLTGDWYA